MILFEILLGIILSLIFLILFYLYIGWCIEKYDKNEELAGADPVMRALLKSQAPESSDTFAIYPNHLLRDSFKQLQFYITGLDIVKV